MDTTYVTIMTVVFLVLVGLAIDVEYMYVSEEELQTAAESAALAGAKAIKQRIQTQIQTDSRKLHTVVNDPVQSSARSAAIEIAAGKHIAAALVGLSNDNTNKISEKNDITVGFWNMSTHSYTPGGNPVNAIQVRTRRTAEDESIGLGSLGRFLARVSGISSFDYTPVAIAALPVKSHANIAICNDACVSACQYPNVCSIPERRMSRDPWDPKKDPPATNRYAFTSLLYPGTSTIPLTDLICKEVPAQDVCGVQIYTTQGVNNDALRDIESMMYNPNVDKSNKEFDKNGKLLGWWVIVPVTSCPPSKAANSFEPITVTKYALIRISRICVSGPAGCRQTDGSYDAPASICAGNEDNGLYIDRISWVSCGDQRFKFPGLQPVLVK